MAQLILLNKPFQVLSQFTDERDGTGKPTRATLADWIQTPDVYPAGRLDYDSEGLLLLTGDGSLQHYITSPHLKMPKTYWVQVEGEINNEAIMRLEQGVTLKDGPTRPAVVKVMKSPTIWARTPPIRHRPSVPTSWIQLTITEGRNRQVRRMTAAVGFPTLRLIRHRIGDWTLEGLEPGQSRSLEVHPPARRGANPRRGKRRPNPAPRRARKP